MIAGVGIDMLDIARIERPMSQPHFMQRVYTDYERDYIARKGAPSAAGIFCAKEAFMKAAGDGLRIPLGEVEVRHGERGEPLIALHGATADRFADASICVSITHTATTAAAVVTIERGVQA